MVTEIECDHSMLIFIMNYAEQVGFYVIYCIKKALLYNILYNLNVTKV